MLTKIMLSKPVMNLDIWLVKYSSFSLLTAMHAIQSKIPMRPALLLTTTGAKSGQPREVVLPYFMDGDDYVVIGSKGGSPQDPAWVTNIRTNPFVFIHVHRVRYQAEAHFAAYSARDRLYESASRAVPSYAYYQKQTTRVIPVLLLRVPR